MPIEYRKPTANNNPGGWTNPQNAYDGAGYPETANAASITSPADADPSLELYGLSAAGQTYTALVLKVHLASAGHSDDQFGVQYSTNGGTNWSDFTGLALGVHNISPATTYSAMLSASQDLTQVRVKVVGDRVKGGDGGTISFYDCWTEGTYTAGSVYDEATTLAMNAGVSPAASALIDSSISLVMSAAQSQGEIADLLASLNLGMNAGVVLAPENVIAAALLLQSSLAAGFEGGVSFDESMSLAADMGAGMAVALIIDAAVSLSIEAAQSQGGIGDLLASLNLGMNAQVALAAISIMSVALALQASMGQSQEGGAAFEESVSFGAAFDDAESAAADIPGDVGLGSGFGQSQEASGDLGGALSLESGFTLSPAAAVDLIASLSFDVQTELTLGAAMILSAAISLNTAKGWVTEGVKAGNTYEEAMSLGMVAAMTQALQLIIQSGVDLGITAGISEGAQLDAAGDVGLGMDAGISIDSQLIGEDSISFDAQFAKALSAAWAGDVSLGLSMIAALISEGEIPAAVTAARRLFQAIMRGRDFKPITRGRDFKGSKIN